MTDCRFCGTPGAYDSGFTVECSNQNCRAFSQKQANLSKVKLEPPDDSKNHLNVPRSSGFMLEPQSGLWTVDIYMHHQLDYSVWFNPTHPFRSGILHPASHFVVSNDDGISTIKVSWDGLVHVLSDPKLYIYLI